MMKTTIKMMFAAAVVMLSACQKEDVSVPSNFPTDGVIRVTTNVETPKSRAGVTTENIERFNIKIDNAANSAYSYYGFYHKSGDAWTCYTDETGSTPLTLLWQNSTQVVTVSALSVYNGSSSRDQYINTLAFYGVQTDQSTEGLLMGSDYLYMEPTVINPATDLVDGKLPITFKHLLSKVHLTVTLGTEFNTTPGTVTNPITELAVEGTKFQFIWNASTNSTFDFTGYSTESITPWHNADAYTAGSSSTTNAVAKYEVILVPQTVAARGFSVSFKIAGKDYTWTSTNAITLERGTLYELNLTAGKDIVTLGGFTAGEWTNGTSGNVETE